MARRPTYLTPQAAADILNVSPGYVMSLIKLGKVEGVQQSSSGRQRIPRAAVERISAEMKATRRKALDSLNEVTAAARAIEDAAAGPPKRRWLKKP